MIRILAKKPNLLNTRARRITQSRPVLEEHHMNESKDLSKWIRCPICNSKTRTKIYADTVLVHFPVFCPKCKRETTIDVVQLKMVKSK